MAKVQDHLNWKVKYIAKELDSEGNALNTREFEKNLLLNEGIQLLQDLLIGAGGTVFNEDNAHIGIGNSTAAAAAAQTGLQGASKFYQPMDAGFPSRTGQTLSFRATIPTSEGNFSIQEITIANGNSDAAVNLNRKVVDLGTKSSEVQFQITIQITVS